ncbi:hypothetical protein UCRNP2_5308 [Neofusicoccum parvum UCRNP2]|uniref:Life-span regulatory factor domain-containing protein n=1 Tax=Botryosphaeria parva (strain UCR-NP2) TaxID=1287680 RepID=R1EJJ0_BOTPV|nr:hypothetical protein UCRNP2_5308 [Neofusicoccum parvum UCRNP2]
MAAEWSHDFCLTCDKQIEHGAYCSQACRLADLDKATDYTGYASAASSYASSTGSSAPGFYFSTYKTSTSAPSSPNLYSPRQPSYFSHSASPSTSSSASDSSKRSLTPSSSQTSLTSMAASATQGLSAQAANELRSYAHAFDQVRDIRRRKQST